MDSILESDHEEVMSVDSGADDSQESSGDADRTNDEQKAKNVAVNQKQNRAVLRLRILVLFVLLAVTFAASYSVYQYTRHQEETAFEEHFHDQATKVVNTFFFNAKQRLEALTGLTAQITSHALNTNETFPFATLPDFERRATTTLQLAEVVAIAMYPIITLEQRDAWTAYSVANQGWLNEGLSVQALAEQGVLEEDTDTLDDLQDQFDKGVSINTTDESVDTTKQIPPFIFKVKPGTTEVAYEDGPGPYAPIWTFAPAIPTWNLVNFNSLSHPSRIRELTALLQRPVPLLSAAADFRENDPLTAGRKDVMNLFLNRWKNGTFDYEEGPVSDLYVPVFDSFDRNSQKLGQVLAAYVYWQSYLTNVLPHGQNGVVCVLENTCGQAFTYILHGPDVTYVGPGDLHESKYDDWMVETGYGAVLGTDAIPTDTTDDSSNDAQCFYNVKVYASSEMSDDYLTWSPVIFACGMVGVFLLTALILGLYDRMVSVRHKTVETKAIQSTAVVQSLFPEKVRERLYEEGASNNKKEAMGSNAFRSGHTPSFGDDMANMVDDNMPIADLHPECTVLFADICGFTKWSSFHTPAEVFKLLETLYCKFDKIAKRRRVFKVETIGDCYVAVTGLPEPQSNHAQIMAKFAAECLTQIGPVLHGLVDKLGPEVADLSMRVGLNSGAVTAGVLRGEKARFQLFGDTVNTAARMESNGQSGRIHIAESTAKLLMGAGLGRWVTPRKHLIEAKGKGKLQTYWLSPESEISFTHKSSKSGGGPRYGRASSTGDSSTHWDDDDDDDDDDENEEEDKSIVDQAVDRLVNTSTRSNTSGRSSASGRRLPGITHRVLDP